MQIYIRYNSILYFANLCKNLQYLYTVVNYYRNLHAASFNIANRCRNPQYDNHVKLAHVEFRSTVQYENQLIWIIQDRDRGHAEDSPGQGQSRQQEQEEEEEEQITSTG